MLEKPTVVVSVNEPQEPKEGVPNSQSQDSLSNKVVLNYNPQNKINTNEFILI